MRTIYLPIRTKIISKTTISTINKSAYALFFALLLNASPIAAQAVLFDFNNGPLYTSLPISQTAGGITANFSATGQGYSIQYANVLGFTPQGFTGNSIYPNSINLSDLQISFSQTLSDFSIMYSCQELGCDDAATMRVTAYMNGVYVGTNTRSATFPGTWPTDTLSCSFSQGFDSVVVHYDSAPPTCQDYGVIYMADNMLVTALNTGLPENNSKTGNLNISNNPITNSTRISFSILKADNISISVYDLSGKLVSTLFEGTVDAGRHQLNWNVAENGPATGEYILKVEGANFRQSIKVAILHP